MKVSMKGSLVVLPTFNEAENVIAVSEKLLALDDSIAVLVVDDNSPDGTAELVERRMREQPRLHLLRRAKKLGLGSAYVAGFRYALERDYAHVVTMDCDFSHNPDELPRLLALQETSGLVIGSRYIPGGSIRAWPLHRRLLSRFANAYTRALLGLPVHDCTSGFRTYRRDVLEAIALEQIRSSGYSFLEEMVLRIHLAGFTIAEVPITFEERRAGISKIDRAEIARAAFHVLRNAAHVRLGLRRRKR
jgi:dolichol-phosphate mannosyltransferase